MNDESKSQPKLVELTQAVERLQNQLATLTQFYQNSQKDLRALQTKRLYQMDFTPGCVKNPAMGEPNSYIYSGLSTKRPTSGAQLKTTGLGCSIWWSTDTHVLSIWDGTIWRTVTLT